MDIELIRLYKSFGERTVLENITHTFPNEQITCILGASGCGKTTLLNIVLGLVAPDSGEIRGVPQGRIATLFQEDRLIPHLSALSNIRIVLRRNFPESEIMSALDAVGLSESAHQPVSQLSGGMQRRTALVRALLADSPLVVMDEPFKGLDAATRTSVIAFTRKMLSGRTALIVTHDPAEASMLNAEMFELK